MAAKIKAFIFFLIIALASAFLVYTAIIKGQKEIQTTAPRRQDVVEAVYATGEVEPVQWTRISPQITGRITTIDVEEGDKVAAGQVLAWMDDAVESARIREHEAEVEYLESEIKRITDLQQKGHASRSDFDEMQSRYQVARAKLDAYRQEIARMHVRTPIGGEVLKRDVEPGETVAPGQVLFWVGLPEKLRITAEVDEEDIPRVHLGQNALIKADAFEELAEEGKVEEITPKGDPVNKNFRVRIGLPDDTPLMVGMTVEVNIIDRVVKDALTVPLSSVIDGRVWVMEGKKTRPVKVETGVTDGINVEILGGLDGGEKILVFPSPQARQLK